MNYRNQKNVNFPEILSTWEPGLDELKKIRDIAHKRWKGKPDISINLDQLSDGVKSLSSISLNQKSLKVLILEVISIFPEFWNFTIEEGQINYFDDSQIKLLLNIIDDL